MPISRGRERLKEQLQGGKRFLPGTDGIDTGGGGRFWVAEGKGGGNFVESRRAKSDQLKKHSKGSTVVLVDKPRGASRARRK